MLDRTEIADLIVARLEPAIDGIAADFQTCGRIRSCQIFNLLPHALATQIHDRFPASERMVLKRSIKENKHVAAQMNAFDPLVEEAVYAFQDPRVVEQVGRITGLTTLEPDSDLYAGGISAMSKGAYLRPHLDNSHDKTRDRYRALNLLYYVTPHWREEDGGSLQLWDDGPTGTPRTVPSRFNSLVIMLTDKASWHSVNEVVGDRRRCCVSNYYFSRDCPDEADYFHATSFRGEPGQVASDLLMRADNALRTTVLKVLGDKLWTNPHVYHRDP
ncbi:2OG-Fe(II) oxygenase [Novosphingobium sp. 9U]|uniref:2OG-Fe(II) oxygenase n=1 Tax=Novosphingobium sp. 9U TaxID=2653158 RepID=UPI0012EF842C|nr:2OG-Fe(II) oxygenase [Novosphingobium sp. 9U]VWX48783.1 2OG-Fe(II) oxygenase [Novosphingobium sp. 9U]